MRRGFDSIRALGNDDQNRWFNERESFNYNNNNVPLIHMNGRERERVPLECRDRSIHSFIYLFMLLYSNSTRKVLSFDQYFFSDKYTREPREHTRNEMNSQLYNVVVCQLANLKSTALMLELLLSLFKRNHQLSREASFSGCLKR